MACQNSGATDEGTSSDTEMENQNQIPITAGVSIGRSGEEHKWCSVM